MVQMFLKKIKFKNWWVTVQIKKGISKIIQENRQKRELTLCSIKVITKLPNSEQSYKGKVQTHNYINRQNQSTTGKPKCGHVGT
jgi:hypothetical protein